MKIKFYLICISLCVTCLIKAQSFLDSAKWYENQQLYTNASVCYERVLFEPKSQQDLETATILKVECLKKESRFLDAIHFIKINLQQISSDSIKNKLYEQWILNCYLTNQLDEGLSLIEQTKSYFPNSANTKWLGLLKILFLNEQNNWKEAKTIHHKWVLEENLDTAALTIYDNIPHLKSEKKAKALATFLPGSGLLYVNHFGEAVSSVLLQAMFLYYGYASFLDKYYLSTWLTGLGIYTSFYSGSIRRTEALVKQHNKKMALQFNQNLKKDLLLQFKK